MKYLILVFSLFVAVLGWSQNIPFVFKGRIENSDIGKPEGGVSIAIVQGGGTLFSVQSSSNGKYVLRGDINFTQPFSVVFSKGGLVGKKVNFDLSKMNEEDIPPGEFRPIETLDMSLFKERDNIDFSFLKTEPVASFDYNTRQMTPRLDAVAMEDMKRRIAKLLTDAEKDKAEADAKYQAAIREADAAYDSEEYEKALVKYEEALGIKPKEPHPANRIVELDALIAAQKEKELAEQQANSEYNNLITAADNLRDQGNWEGAVDKYKQAVTKKDEQYPKDQIADLTAKIAQKKKEEEAQEAYDAAMKSGNMFLKQNSLRAAKDKFTEASNLKPSEDLPKQKLKEIEDKLKAAEEAEMKKQQYNDALAAADQFFDAEDFASAKGKYEEALSFEASSTYAKGRLQICKDKLAEELAEQAKQEEINTLMSEGQTALDNKSYDDAIQKFTAVLAIDGAHAEAQQKLTLAQQKKEEANQQAVQEQEFNELVSQGDQMVSDEKYEDAIQKYEAAVAIIPSAEVDQKITSARAKLEEQKALAEKDAEFKALIEEGNQLIASEKLNEAKAKFEEAKGVDPNSPIPAEKIDEINNILASQQAAIEKQFNDLVSEGDQAMSNEQYEAAIQKYEAALAVTPSSEVDQKIADARAKIEEQNALAQQNAEFSALIEEGNQLMSDDKLNEAKAKFEAAKAIDSNSPIPTEKINEINSLLAGQKAEQDRKASYEAAVTAADNLFDSGKWNESKSKYQEALGFTDDKSYAEGRINEIEGKLSTAAEAEKKAKEIEGLLQAAKALYSTGKLEEAKDKYSEVLAVDAQNQIAAAEIEKINGELAAQKSEAEKEQAFNNLKDEGFALADQKKHVEAKLKLQEALTLKDDASVRAKLSEIEEALKAEGEMAATEEKYNGLISEAQGLESSGDFQGAISKYQAASSVKPSESLPKQKIAELESLIQDNAAQAEIDKKYNDHIQAGDRLVSEENYLDAIKEYNKALQLKPTEQLPVDKANEAERLAKESKSDEDRAIEKNLRIAREKVDQGAYDRANQILNSTEGLKPKPEHVAQIDELREQIKTLQGQEKKYNDLMSEADGLAGSKQYADAKLKYLEASQVKPTEQLPKDKAEEMQRLLEEASSVAQKDALYQEYMNNGASHRADEEYNNALSSYQNALSLKPGDMAAQNKIDEIQQIIDNIENANAEVIEKKNKYDKFIKAADELFAQESWLDAKAQYDEALKIFPTDNYAKLQVAECIKRERQKTLDDEEKQYMKLISAADKNFDEENYDKAINRYKLAISFRGDDPYPKKRLAEIDAILNPVQTESAELEDLGTPFDGSLLDGQALLAQAEEQRKTSKGQGIQKEFDKAAAEQSEKATEKRKDHYENSNEIYETYKQITVESGENDLGRQETVETLRAEERERSEEDKNQRQFEYAENVSDQEAIYTINKEVEMNYGERDEVYMENADMMHSYNTELATVAKEKRYSEHNDNIRGDQRIIAYKSDVQNEIIEDFEERDKVRQEVYDTQQEVSAQNDNLTRTDHEDNYDAKKVINDVVTNVETKTAEDIQIAQDNNVELRDVQEDVRKTAESMSGIEDNDHYNANKKLDGIKEGYDSKVAEDQRSVLNNNEELVDVKQIITESELVQTQVETDHVRQADRDMAVIKSEMVSDQQGMDENRKESVEILKEGQRELSESHYENYNREKERSLSNKAYIDSEVEANNEVAELADEAHSKKVEYVNIMDKKARTDVEGINISDEAERLNAKKSIEGVYTDVQDNSKDEAEKHVESGQALVATKKVISAQESNQAIGQNEKHYDAADKIHKVDDSPEEKVKVANDLGEEYPEGVSQEQFTQNDQNGLMTAIVTRRIVVIEGHADVYVRTQTTHGITYSKNGKPSMQHVWNSETQGPHLERHF